jgi:8-oxo-dGTP diphosphatase
MKLVATLKDVAFKRVLSSPYRRCVETVEPLAHARGLEVEATEVLAEGMGLEGFLKLVDEVRDDAVYCGHADLAIYLLESLVDARLVRPQAARLEKGSTWILELRKGAFKSARYLPPP